MFPGAQVSKLLKPAFEALLTPPHASHRNPKFTTFFSAQNHAPTRTNVLQMGYKHRWPQSSQATPTESASWMAADRPWTKLADRSVYRSYGVCTAASTKTFFSVHLQNSEDPMQNHWNTWTRSKEPNPTMDLWRYRVGMVQEGSELPEYRSSNLQNLVRKSLLVCLVVC